MNAFDAAFDHIYVISLASSSSRRAYIREHFNEIGITRYEFFDGVVGADLDLDDRKASGMLEDKPQTHGGVDLLPGEVGASWSHIEVYNDAVERGFDRVMVCEDDIRFRDDANERLTLYLEEVPADWDIIHFQSLRAVGSGGEWDARRKRLTEHVYRGYNEGAGASCYALTRRCIEFLLRHAFPINKAPDGLTNWPTGWWEACRGYKGYIVDPLLCESGVFDSDIGERPADVPGILLRRWRQQQDEEPVGTE